MATSPLDNFKGPNIWEMDFIDGEQGSWAKQVCEELKEQSSLMNADAPVIEANGQDEHKWVRDNEFDDTAHAVAKDEGYYATPFTHEEVARADMGLIQNAKEFSQRQERWASDKESYRARKVRECVQGLNRKDDKVLIYGSHGSNAKEYNGLSHYCSSITSLATWESNLFQTKSPFEGKDACLCLDNQDGASSSSFSDGTSIADDDTNKYASIYAVVWGVDTVTKLIPRGQMAYAGIHTEEHRDLVRTYTDKADSIAKTLFYDSIVFEKATGLAVINRFGIMRLANIKCNLKGLASVEELKRIEYNVALIESYLSHVGLLERAKIYASPQLIQFMQRARTGNVTQVNVTVRGDNTGKPNGYIGDFIINDSFVVNSEPMMNKYESLVE